MKNTAALVLLSVAMAGTCHGEGVVRQLAWTQAPAGATLVAPRPGQAGAAIRIERQAGGIVPLVRVEKPPLSTATWAVRGEVRYEGVAGDGYLEMWSVFADGRYFSRTLDQRGPMGRLSGSSDWREFVLPFFSRPDLPAPVALEINLVLPAGGSVEIGPMRLVQYAAGEHPMAQASGAWWTEQQGGWIGGAAGLVFGVLGSTLGWLGSKGRAPAFVIGASRLAAGLGAVALAGGVAAVASGQPYAVWFPLLLAGTIACGVMGPASRRFARRYREIELRRLQSLDAR